MKNGATYFKWSAIVICFIIAFLMLRRCGNGGGGKTPTIDTIIHVDTIYKEIATDSDYMIFPYETVKWKTKEVYRTDTLEIFNYHDVDSTKILEAFFAERRYKDSINIEYGKVYIYDTVTQNQIVGRRVSTNLSIPTITKTVTLTQPKRTVFYLGVEALASDNYILSATGISAGFKFKNDKYWGLKGMILTDGKPLYGLEVKVPIRFKKR